jgi:alpha-L-rhamnosidase
MNFKRFVSKIHQKFTNFMIYKPKNNFRRTLKWWHLKVQLLLIFFCCISTGFAQLNVTSISKDWKAAWISSAGNTNKANNWTAFRKIIDLKLVPVTVVARIAVDSKYWLWINGRLVVFEGGLKRGPNPQDTYYDEVDIAPYLKKGKNTIAVLAVYFGKDGFSHKSSGKAGFIFDCQSDNLEILSDKSWRCVTVKAYQSAGNPLPNSRLSEASILFDARLELGNWKDYSYDETGMDFAVEHGYGKTSPWNNLVLRPIPLWKDFGFKKYINQKVSKGPLSDTIICSLPYNAQITPYFKLESKTPGQKVIICTDNYLFYNGGDVNIRAEYLTKAGVQEYESLGWLNGQKVYYIIPKGIKVLDLRYRETGFDTEFSGSFHCSDPFFNELWTKSRRTLYLTMRDTYMDCPDRERAQWTGDAVNESGEAFYALSTSSHSLAKKWLKELVNWQRPDGSMYSPVPSGNWNKELPGQVTASLGYYGLWNYYLHTGDKQTVADLYEGSKRYLALWKPDGKGTMELRKGDWTWGDWGEDKDMVLISNSWYYLAIKGMRNLAAELGKSEDAVRYETFLRKFKTSYNAQFWNGTAYRHPDYKDKTDDRVQALAVVSGLADPDKYDAILKVFETEEHASPYMEKYVFEALFQMGYPDKALERQKKRFSSMVNNPNFTTLFEGWGFGKEGYGGGTVNHAWSGGGLTILSQYLCGIAPLKPAYELFQILPQPGSIERASAEVTSVKGLIKSSFINKARSFKLNATVPMSSIAILGVPNKGYKTIKINNKVVWRKGQYFDNALIKGVPDQLSGHVKFVVPAGNWNVEASR